MQNNKTKELTPQKPCVTTLIAAFKAKNHLEGCLDSILNQKKDFPSLEVLVGIDDCNETWNLAKKLSLKYGRSVQFWRSTENVGPFIIKNSLLKKMQKRDGLVLFFDSDDLMPRGLLKDYVDRYLKEKNRNNKISGLRLNLIDFPEDLFSDFRKTTQDAPQGLLNSIIEHGAYSFYGRIGEKVAAFHTMKLRYRPSLANGLRMNCRPAHGVALVEAEALEAVGAYNEMRVGMDTDLLNRLEMNGSPVWSDQTASWFIRRVSTQSLSMSPKTGLNSTFRKRIHRELQRRRTAGIVKASWATVKLHSISQETHSLSCKEKLFPI